MSANADLAGLLNGLYLVPSGNLNQLKNNDIAVIDWASDHTWKPSPTHENYESDEFAAALNATYGGVTLVSNTPMVLKDGNGGQVTWNSHANAWIFIG